MKLSEKHERRIATFIREIGGHLSGVAPDVRARNLAELRHRVDRALKRLPGQPTDQDVDAILHDCALELVQAKEARETPQAANQETEADADRRWLGVCAVLAERFGTSVGAVRTAFVLLGLVTGPLALFVYAVLFLAMRFSPAKEQLPTVRRLHVLKFTLASTAAVLAFHFGAELVLAGLSYLTVRFLEQDLVSLGRWDWLEQHLDWVLAGALVFLFPIALLSGLPLANDWDTTGKKVLQAGLALYALVLAFGLACVIAGILLLTATRLTGFSLLP